MAEPEQTELTPEDKLLMSPHFGALIDQWIRNPKTMEEYHKHLTEQQKHQKNHENASKRRSITREEIDAWDWQTEFVRTAPPPLWEKLRKAVSPVHKHNTQQEELKESEDSE